jgi:flagellar biogenesis protein FliO
MSQTEMEHPPEVAAKQKEEARTTVSTVESAVPKEFKYAVVVMTVAILLVLSLAGVTGSTWAFVPVYLSAVLTYIAGGLYLFKHLMDYDSPGHHGRITSDAS